DRSSAYETLQGRAAQAQQQADTAAAQAEAERQRAAAEKVREREETREARAAPRPRASGRQSMGEAFATSLLRTIANQAGREIMRGLMGGLSRRR
ncbi:MAG: DUF853 family protein, partial [Caulobacter sp.]|nr:DUF853 family protein [Caulobacter sp.]